MFAKSRFNWASSEIETILKFNFGMSDEPLEVAKRLLSAEYAFEGVYTLKKLKGCDWYDAIYFWCTEQLQDNKCASDEEKLSQGIMRVFCVIKIACEIKAGNVRDPDTALRYVQAEYKLWDLGEIPD